MSSQEPTVLDAKLYVPDDVTKVAPYVHGDHYEIQSTELGSRLVVTTCRDRIDIFKALIDVFPGPYFLTVVSQEDNGAFGTAGRFYSEPGKTRIQIDYFLDYFHDYISYEGFHHFWVTCETTQGIIVYDQHDQFFVYERAAAAAEVVKGLGFTPGKTIVDFVHCHRDCGHIVPGAEELRNYGRWRRTSLEIQDVSRPEKKTLRNAFLRIRTFLAIQKIKRRRGK